MSRIDESFRRCSREGGIKLGNIIIAAIICLSLLSIGSGTLMTVDSNEKEKDRKAIACLKEFKDLQCNVFNPTQACKPVLECIRSRNENFLQELKTLAFTGFGQIEKLSVIPLAIVGLVILSRKR